MSLLTHERTGTRHTDTQRKAEGGEGGKNWLKVPRLMLLPLATLINKRYNQKHGEFYQVYQNHWQQLAAVAPSCLHGLSHAGQHYLLLTG